MATATWPALRYLCPVDASWACDFWLIRRRRLTHCAVVQSICGFRYWRLTILCSAVNAWNMCTTSCTYSLRALRHSGVPFFHTCSVFISASKAALLLALRVKHFQHSAAGANSTNTGSESSLTCKYTSHAIREFLVPRSEMSARATRSSEGGDLHLQRCRLESSRRAFSYRGAATWNAVPNSVRDSPTLNVFKAALRSL